MICSNNIAHSYNRYFSRYIVHQSSMWLWQIFHIFLGNEPPYFAINKNNKDQNKQQEHNKQINLKNKIPTEKKTNVDDIPNVSKQDQQKSHD